MNSQQLYDLLPLIVLATAPVLLLFCIAIKRNHVFAYSVTVISLLAFLGITFQKFMSFTDPKLIGELIIIDRFSLFYLILVGISALAILILAYYKLSLHSANREEFYVLFLTALLGSGIMLSSVHFASFFLGLEILSVSLYPLIAYLKNNLGIEAGIKYLILAAASSAFLLFGIGLIYLDLGTMHFPALADKMSATSELSFIGLSLLLVAVGFKLAVVPFHLWTPDIYQGASSPVSALIATISKGSVIAFFIRFMDVMQGFQWEWMVTTWSVIALASMLFGNVLALRQSNLKRLLAYSSIAHLGYLMVAVLAGQQGYHAVTFYLAAYFVTIIIAFGVVSLLGNDNDQLEVEKLKGLFWSQPKIAVLMTLAFLSLAGIPLTAGFMGKYYLLTAGVASELWLLVIVLVISSVIGLFYYLRVIMKMLQSADDQVIRFTPAYAVVGVLAIVLLILGIYPSDLISLIKGLGLF